MYPVLSSTPTRSHTLDTHGLGQAGVSFAAPASAPRPTLFSSAALTSNHHRSSSLSALVRRSSTRRRSGLALPGRHASNTASTSGTTPELIQIISRSSAEARRAPEPSSDHNPLRHSLSSSSSSAAPAPPPQPALVHLNTLPIIQPRSTSAWNSSYDLDRRSFRVNLHNPRQQVTSLLALSSIPRPLTPPFDEERENSASMILTATRTAIEEEAIQAAIAASLEPGLTHGGVRRPDDAHEHQPALPHHWADHRPSAAVPRRRDNEPDQDRSLPNPRTTLELDWSSSDRPSQISTLQPDPPSQPIRSVGMERSTPKNPFRVPPPGLSHLLLPSSETPTRNSFSQRQPLGSSCSLQVPTHDTLHPGVSPQQELLQLQLIRQQQHIHRHEHHHHHHPINPFLIQPPSSSSTNRALAKNNSSTIPPASPAIDRPTTNSRTIIIPPSQPTTTTNNRALPKIKTQATNHHSSSSSSSSFSSSSSSSSGPYSSPPSTSPSSPIPASFLSAFGSPRPSVYDSPLSLSPSPLGARCEISSTINQPSSPPSIPSSARLTPPNLSPLLRSNPSNSRPLSDSLISQHLPPPSSSETSSSFEPAPLTLIHLKPVPPMLSQFRASFQPKASYLSEQEKLQPRSTDQLLIPNITEPRVLSPIPDHEENVPESQLSPSSLSQNLSPSSMTHSSLSPVSPGFQSFMSEPQATGSSSISSNWPSKPAMPAEMFVIVRPPPGKQNHPLNLQIQLILPNAVNPSREPSLSTPALSNSSPHQSQIFAGRPMSSAPEAISENPLQLNRTQSIRSVHSNRSSRSNRTCSSGGEGRNRRVTPLYNLQWHTVLPTWICDAGTDAKVAKFAKKGIELVELANIEPSEIRSSRYGSDLNLLLNGGPISPPAQVNTFLSTVGTPTPGLNKQDRPGAAALFNKVKRMNVFNKKAGSKVDPEAVAASKTGGKKFAGISASEHCSHSDLPSTNGGLSCVGPTMEAGGRRAEGYVWIVRKWTKPEIVDWQNSSPKTNQLNPVFIEWRKSKRRLRAPAKAKSDPEQGSAESTSHDHPVAPPPPIERQPTPPAPVEPQRNPPTPPPIAPDSALKLFTIPAATTMGVMNFFGRFTKPVEAVEPEGPTSTEEGIPVPSVSEPAVSTDDHPGPRSTEGQPPTEVEASGVAESPAESTADEDEEDSGEDSDPEDSERPWLCELVVQALDGRQQRFFVASLTPHPHHPKLVAQLAVPWNLEPITLRRRSSATTVGIGAAADENEAEDDTFLLHLEDIKDLVAVTCMWLVVKERLGGVGKRRKGDRAWRI